MINPFLFHHEVSCSLYLSFNGEPGFLSLRSVHLFVCLWFRDSRRTALPITTSPGIARISRTFRNAVVTNECAKIVERGFLFFKDFYDEMCAHSFEDACANIRCRVGAMRCRLEYERLDGGRFRKIISILQGNAPQQSSITKLIVPSVPTYIGDRLLG